MFVIVAAVAFSALSVVLGVILDANFEQLVTAALTTVNTVLLIWGTGKMKKVDDIKAIAQRKLGDRHPAVPRAREQWDGIERRRNGRRHGTSD